MVTQEEARIRLGVDHSQVAQGMASARTQLASFAMDVKNELRSLKDIASLATGFGIGGGVLESLKKGAAAAGEFFGKFSADGFAAEARLKSMAGFMDMIKRKFRELNNLRWEEEKNVESAKRELDEARLERIKKLETEEGKIARLQKEYTEAEFNAQFYGGNKESKRLELKAIAIRKQGELQAAINEKEEKAEKRKLDIEKDRAKLKQTIIEKEAQLAELKKRETQQERDKYKPTMDELANDPTSPFHKDAAKYKANQERIRQLNRQGKFSEAEKLFLETEGGAVMTEDKWSKLSNTDKLIYAKQKKDRMPHMQWIDGIRDKLEKAGVIEKREVNAAIISTAKEVEKARQALDKLNSTDEQ